MIRSGYHTLAVLLCLLIGTGPSAYAQIDSLSKNALKENIYQSHLGELTQSKDVDISKIESSKFKNSMLIPGTGVRWKFNGYFKTDVIFDIRNAGNQDKLVISTIPTNGSAEADLTNSLNFHVRQSRIGLDFRSKTKLGIARAFIEVDFFDDNSVNPITPRMRHAIISLGRLMIGRYWTLITDPYSLPITVDFFTGDGSASGRVAQFRYTQPAKNYFSWAVALEKPTTDILNPGDLSGESNPSIPAISAYFQFEDKDKFHLRVSAMINQVRFDGTLGEKVQREMGYGLQFSMRWVTWKKDFLSGKIGYGSGWANHVSGFGAADGIVNNDGKLRIIPVGYGGFNYVHYWSQKINLRSSVVYTFSILNDDPKFDYTSDQLVEGSTFHLNLLYSPIVLFDMGIEYSKGHKVLVDGSTGSGHRLQFMVKINLY